jgi:hypothetical protein
MRFGGPEKNRQGTALFRPRRTGIRCIEGNLDGASHGALTAPDGSQRGLQNRSNRRNRGPPLLAKTVNLETEGRRPGHPLSHWGFRVPPTGLQPRMQAFSSLCLYGIRGFLTTARQLSPVSSATTSLSRSPSPNLGGQPSLPQYSPAVFTPYAGFETDILPNLQWVSIR